MMMPFICSCRNNNYSYTKRTATFPAFPTFSAFANFYNRIFGAVQITGSNLTFTPEYQETSTIPCRLKAS